MVSLPKPKNLACSIPSTRRRGGRSAASACGNRLRTRPRFRDVAYAAPKFIRDSYGSRPKPYDVRCRYAPSKEAAGGVVRQLREHERVVAPVAEWLVSGVPLCLRVRLYLPRELLRATLRSW